jgi:hypothetical protein
MIIDEPEAVAQLATQPSILTPLHDRLGTTGLMPTQIIDVDRIAREWSLALNESQLLTIKGVLKQRLSLVQVSDGGSSYLIQ